MQNPSDQYIERKRFLSQILTIFGRKPVLEALEDTSIDVYRLHVADSNKPAPVLNEILNVAQNRGIEVLYHDKKVLSRISKNGKQDQGIALDLKLKGFSDYRDYLENPDNDFEFIALDNITTPANLGMIIRSVCASPATGLIIPNKGSAKLDSLVIKASAGTLFKARILRCESLQECLQAFSSRGCEIYGMDVNADTQTHQIRGPGKKIFVMGNESDGLSQSTSDLCTNFLKIPMSNGVESLNVAVTASLICFREVI